MSTNGGSFTQDALVLTYTPVGDFVGADQCEYSLSDGVEYSTGYVNINVLPLLSPTIAAPVVSGSSITLSGTGGAAGGGYRVLSSTNIATALAEWTVVASDVFSVGGTFSSTIGVSSGVPEKYFTISVP
jgi:hypothetical protein